MREIVASLEGEWRRYKIYAERAMEQARDDELAKSDPGGNSIAIIVWHISGTLKSRFTDFLTSDGEKSWRHRDSEFEQRTVTRAELMQKWDEGWAVLFHALGPLTDDDLSRTVTIRGEKFLVIESLIRLLPHTSYHAG